MSVKSARPGQPDKSSTRRAGHLESSGHTADPKITRYCNIDCPRNGSGTCPAEMTFEEIVYDPMIANLNRVDGISTETFVQLLDSASRVTARR